MATAKLCKHNMVQLHDFVCTHAALATQADVDVVTMSPNTPCAHQACAVTHIIGWQYG